MPEAPDVEVFRRYTEGTAVGRRIEGVHAERLDDLGGLSRQKLVAALHGRTIEATARHGKFLFAGLDDDGWLVLHFGMTGFPAFYRDSEQAPDHVRLRLDLAGGGRFAYSCQRLLGRIDLAEDVASFVEREELGPDALEIEREEFRSRIGRKRGSLKAALMDQSAMAGVGNVYADETLFQARLHPERSPADLDRATLDRLRRVLRRVLQTAIERGADAQAFPASWLTPLRGKQAPCPRCGGRVERERVSGRMTYFCPWCQRA